MSIVLIYFPISLYSADVIVNLLCLYLFWHSHDLISFADNSRAAPSSINSANSRQGRKLSVGDHLHPIIIPNAAGEFFTLPSFPRRHLGSFLPRTKSDGAIMNNSSPSTSSSALKLPPLGSKRSQPFKEGCSSIELAAEGKKARFDELETTLTSSSPTDLKRNSTIQLVETGNKVSTPESSMESSNEMEENLHRPPVVHIFVRKSTEKLDAPADTKEQTSSVLGEKSSGGASEIQ